MLEFGWQICSPTKKDWNRRMSGVEGRHSSSDGPQKLEAAPHGFRHAALQFLFGIIGLALITFAAGRLHLQPGAI